MDTQNPSTSAVSTVPEAKEKKVKKMKVALLYDYWDEDGERHSVGSEVELPEDAAIDIVNEGKAKLAKR